MTNPHLSFDDNQIDDEIDQLSHIANSDLQADSADARLLADLRRAYRSDEGDTQSLARVYARLCVRARERSAVSPAAGSAESFPSSRLTQKGWHWLNPTTSNLPPVSADIPHRSRRPYLTTGISVLLVVGLLIGSFWIFTALRARNTGAQVQATPTQQPIHDGKLACSASSGGNYDLLMSAHPELDWSATGRLALAHPYLKIASAQTCASEPVNWQVNPSRPVWSPDGRRLLLLTTNTLVGDTGHVLDAATGRELAAIHTEPGQSFEQAVWTSDGTQIVAIVHIDYLSHSTESLAVQVWNASTGVVVKDALLPREVLIGSVSLAPNGANFTMQRTDHRVEFWNVATGKLVSVTAAGIVEGDAYSPAIGGVWSRNGASFAIALPNPSWPASATEIQVYSTATGQRTATFQESDTFEGMIGALAWSPDGKYLAESSGAIHIWDVATQKVVATFGKITFSMTSSDGKTTTISWIAALAWAPDSRGLASITGSSNGSGARPDQMTNTLNVWRLS